MYINYILNKSTKHFAVFKKTGASASKKKEINNQQYEHDMAVVSAYHSL